MVIINCILKLRYCLSCQIKVIVRIFQALGNLSWLPRLGLMTTVIVTDVIIIEHYENDVTVIVFFNHYD